MVTFICIDVTFSNKTRADINMALLEGGVPDTNRIRPEYAEPERNFNSTIDGQNI